LGEIYKAQTKKREEGFRVIVVILFKIQIMHRLSREELGNFDEYIERLSQCKLLNEQEIKVLCDKAKYGL
jgi:hypothetical protein